LYIVYSRTVPQNIYSIIPFHFHTESEEYAILA